MKQSPGASDPQPCHGPQPPQWTAKVHFCVGACAVTFFDSIHRVARYQNSGCAHSKSNWVITFYADLRSILSCARGLRLLPGMEEEEAHQLYQQFQRTDAAAKQKQAWCCATNSQSASFGSLKLQLLALCRAWDLGRQLPHRLLWTTPKTRLTGRLLTSFLTSFNKLLRLAQASAAGHHITTSMHQRSGRGLTVAHLLAGLHIEIVTRRHTISKLARNSEPGTIAVAMSRKSTTETRDKAQGHQMTATADNITGALAKLRASVTQTDTPAGVSSLPTPIMSDTGTTGAVICVTENIIPAEAGLVPPPAGGRPA